MISAELFAGWKLEAECVGAPPDIFFPPRGGTYREARVYCDRCPVKIECLEEALVEEAAQAGTEFHGRYGMRGGLTPDQRDVYVDGIRQIRALR